MPSSQGTSHEEDGFSPAPHAGGVITSNGAVFYPVELLYPLSRVVNVFTLPEETLQRGPPRLTDPPGMFTPLTDDPVSLRQHLDDLLQEEVETLFHKNPLRVVRALLYSTAVAYHAGQRLERMELIQLYQDWWVRAHQLVYDQLRSISSQKPPRDFPEYAAQDSSLDPNGLLNAAFRLPLILLEECAFYPDLSRLAEDGQTLAGRLAYSNLPPALQKLHVLARRQEEILTHHLSKAYLSKA